MAEIHCERLHDLASPGLAMLVAESEQAGLSLVRRLVDEWRDGTNRFDRPGEALFGASIDGSLVGVGGLTIDPYLRDDHVGRVRHLYVLVARRRLGVGRVLMDRVLEAARGRFAVLRLSTHNPAAARLYEALGFRPVSAPHCTHLRELA